MQPLDAPDAPPRQLTFETERSLGGYMWADNQRLLYMKDHAGDENYQLYGICLPTHTPAPIRTFPA